MESSPKQWTSSLSPSPSLKCPNSRNLVSQDTWDHVASGNESCSLIRTCIITPVAVLCEVSGENEEGQNTCWWVPPFPPSPHSFQGITLKNIYKILNITTQSLFCNNRINKIRDFSHYKKDILFKDFFIQLTYSKRQMKLTCLKLR